jgi:hypothetical protein
MNNMRPSTTTDTVEDSSRPGMFPAERMADMAAPYGPAGDPFFDRNICSNISYFS